MKFLIALLISTVAQAQTYNCTVTTQSDLNITGNTTLSLAANSARRCLSIQNKLIVGNAASTLEVKYLPSGMTSSSTSFTGVQGLKIASTDGVYMPIILPINAIYLKATSGTVPVTIIEGQ